MGLPSTPTNLSAISLATSIDFSWSQLAGDLVESYTLHYSFITRGCDGTVFGGDTIKEIDSSTSSYTLSGLEEDSDFHICITAVNGAGSSAQPAKISSTTLIAGGISNTHDIEDL